MTDTKIASPFSSWNSEFLIDFKQEMKCFFSIFIPCALTTLFRMLNPIISIIMCGHLSKYEFDAVSLANSIINVFGFSIELGFSTSFNTLFAQVYGSKQKKKMGIILQKAIAIMTLIYILLIGFHMNMEPILLSFKQDFIVANLASKYIMLYLPGLFFDFQFMTISRYLQNQNIVYPMTVSSFLGNILNFILQFLAIYVFKFGFQSSAICQAISSLAMFTIQLSYILMSRIYKDTWNGFSLKGCFNNWKLIFALGLPGILMVAVEEWGYETATFIAGSMNTVQLGAQSVAFQFSLLTFLVSIGVYIATSVRIGQSVGNGDLKSIKTIIIVNTITQISICCLLCSVTLVFRQEIGFLFTNDKEIQKESAILLIYLAFLPFLDVCGSLFSGVLSGCGRQSTGGFIMAFSFYIIGIPSGLVFIYVLKTNIQGMWIGFTIALFFKCALSVGFVYFTNWNDVFKQSELNVDNIQLYELTLYEDLDVDTKTKDCYVIGSIKYLWKSILKKPQPSYLNFDKCPDEDLNHETSQFIKIDKDFINKILIILLVICIFVCALIFRFYSPTFIHFSCVFNSNETIQFSNIYQSRYCNLTF